jgi:hypothetical protein
MSKVRVIAALEHGFTKEQSIIERRIWRQMKGAYDLDLVMIEPRAEVSRDLIVGTAVFLNPWEGMMLSDYTHPAEVTYLFGNALTDLLYIKEAGDDQVRISTPKPCDMFGCSAAAIVLDRRTN